MIEYTKHSFGLNVFWTVFTGSAYPKAVPAALLSGIFHLFLEWILSDYDKEQMKIGHPYALGVVFTAVGFLIVFRANHAYGRLAAAADHLYHMETRSFDGIMQFKAFHMQTEEYKTGQEKSKAWLAEFYHLYSLTVALSCMALRRDEDLRNLVGYEPTKVVSSKVAFNSLNVPDGEERFYRPQSFLRRLHYAASMRSSPELNLVYHRHNKLEVWGGISAEECAALQTCASPKVRAELACMWLTSFLTAAEKAGELGKTPPPIVSRAYAWLSEGMIGFSKALRVVEVPFPFIIAQIAELSVISLVPLVPILHHSVVEESVYLGAGFSFLTCLIFIGLYESARDVEDPFAYEPNDLPLVGICRRFNECIYAADVYPVCPEGVRMLAPLTQVQDLEQNPGLIVGGVRAASRIVHRMSIDVGRISGAGFDRTASGRVNTEPAHQLLRDDLADVHGEHEAGPTGVQPKNGGPVPDPLPHGLK
mmetsp:Transcript_9528/g.22559  ORF Transcript_9528/g.22559 Transcript_9528/m.22559 type:complete len:477 (+) Transcript_9528:193-1623(+)